MIISFINSDKILSHHLNRFNVDMFLRKTSMSKTFPNSEFISKTLNVSDEMIADMDCCDEVVDILSRDIAKQLEKKPPHRIIFSDIILIPAREKSNYGIKISVEILPEEDCLKYYEEHEKKKVSN